MTYKNANLHKIPELNADLRLPHEFFCIFAKKKKYAVMNAEMTETIREYFKTSLC